MCGWGEGRCDKRRSERSGCGDRVAGVMQSVDWRFAVCDLGHLQFQLKIWSTVVVGVGDG